MIGSSALKNFVYNEGKGVMSVKYKFPAFFDNNLQVMNRLDDYATKWGQEEQILAL